MSLQPCLKAVLRFATSLERDTFATTLDSRLAVEVVQTRTSINDTDERGRSRIVRFINLIGSDIQVDIRNWIQANKGTGVGRVSIHQCPVNGSERNWLGCGPDGDPRAQHTFIDL